jgi:hypothetical protein
VLAAELEASSYGVTCVVPSNIAEPWLHFEAGAIAKIVGEARLVPLVHQLDPSALPGPLAQFQAVPCSKEGLGRLLRAINRRSTTPIDEDSLADAFDSAWPDFEEAVRTSSAPKPATQVETPAPQLRVRMGYIGSWRHEQIIIENVGDIVARDISVSIDERPFHEAQFVLGNQRLERQLRPGEEIGIKIALSMQSPERIDVRVEWVDEDGRAGSYEKLLTLI